MAGEAVVGALRVILGMDTAQFEDGAKKASQSINSFGKQMSATFAALQLDRIVEKTFDFLSNSIKRALVLMENMKRDSQKFGVPVEELTKLRYAAEQSDVPFESLAKSIGFLNRNMLDIASGGGQKARQAFESLQIAIQNSDGTFKSNTQVLEELANKFAKMEDGGQKSALAMRIFGKAGADMVPFLNQGAEGIQKLFERAEQLGLVFTDQTADAADKFNDSLKDLGYVAEGIAIKVTAQLLPALQNIVTQLVEFSKDPEKVRRAAEIIVAGLTHIITVAVAIPTVIGNAVRAFENLQIAISAFSTSGPTFKQAWDQIRANLKTNAEEWDKLGIKIQGVKDLITSPPEEFGPPKPAGLGKEKPPLPIDEAAFNRMLALFQQSEEAGIRMAESLRTPFEEIADQTAEITRLRGLEFISLETYERAMVKAGLRIAEVWGQTAQSIVSPMADAFKTLAQMNKKFAGAAKALAIAEALVNTYLAATKALASGVPPFNYIAAAAVTAAGLANVAKISATEFAHGGSFKVGGTGGVDSQMVSFKATPGEMVDVRTPGQQRGGAVTEIVLSGFNTRDFFTGDRLRDFIDSINRAHSDGYRLKIGTA